jgi:glycosyltransferase involved in cell wall biosynthesis
VKRRLVVIGPLPPPVHGVTVSTSLVLANPLLHERFAVEHLDTSDPRSRANVGRWDSANAALALRACGRLATMLRGDRGVVYLPLSQGTPGFLRDSLLIHYAALRGWAVAAHLRGSDFPTFFQQHGPLFRRWIRLTLRKVDAIAVMGSSLRELFAGLVPDERVSVVPNGTPDLVLNGVRHEPEQVLFLSNLRRRKGVREALEAALMVLERRPSAQFVFAGAWEDASLERELGDLATRAGDRVRFLSSVDGDEKRALLLSSAVLLFPPREPEGHPRIVLEAIAAGLPVVTTNRGAIAETVLDGQTGFVLDHPVPEQLAERVLALLADQGLREQLGRAARADYEARFRQEHADRRLADWLEEIAGS